MRRSFLVFWFVADPTKSFTGKKVSSKTGPPVFGQAAFRGSACGGLLIPDLTNIKKIKQISLR